MNPRPASRLWPAVLLLALAISVHAALVYGGIVYTKRIETKLLAEPNPLASVSAKVGYAKQLAVEETQGAWLRVREGTNAGWVFSGNVSETKIVEGTGSAGLGLSASKTTVTAATRGLSEEAKAYAGQRKLVNAGDDLAWLLEQSETLTAEDVEKYLQEQKKGEYK